MGEVMGLVISHDAFSGSYSSFNRFRQVVAKATGGSFPPHENTAEFTSPEMWYVGDEYSRETHPGLFAFLGHSDCDGELTVDECQQIINEMTPLLPLIAQAGYGHGHIAGQGGYLAVANRFLDGCRDAVSQNEPLVFY